jgi:hypothetical protein
VDRQAVEDEKDLPDYAASSADFGMAQSMNVPVFPER